MSDLFETGPRTGRDHPETSFDAADTIRPAVGTIREQVLAFALAHGGFIDDELAAAHPDSPESSFRKRRTELAEEGWIVDTGETRRNRQGNECVIWVHRDRHPNPPPLRGRGPSKAAVQNDARAMVPQLHAWAKQMRSEGRGAFANGLEEAAEIMAQLAG